MSASAPIEGALFEWNGPAVGLLDLDAFFASVEQLDHPEWRGKPLIVGGSPERRGVVTTASYEARPYGVHSAMPSAQAARLCPNAIWTHGRFDRYREVSDQVMALIADETPLLEQVSIDEAFFDVTPGRFNKEHPVAICRRMQQRVAELGVTCSIGIGVNKTVAKIASDKDKPRGLTVVPPGTEAMFLEGLPVRAMSGVGASTERKLHAMGVFTLGQLAARDPRDMERAFGVAGPRMVERAAGRERSLVHAIDDKDDAKSVSNERTFSRDLTSVRDVEAAVLSVAAKVGSRLRRKGLAGREVTLRLKFDFAHAKTAQRQLPCRTDDESVFGPAALELLHEVWEPGVPVRLVGVGVSRFDEAVAPVQLGLFDVGAFVGDDTGTGHGGHAGGDGRARRGGSAQRGAGHDGDADKDAAEDPRPGRRRNLAVTADDIRERFGSSAIAFGRDLRLKEQESDTVPMNKDRF